MPLEPPIVEEVLAVIEKVRPEPLTATQTIVLRMAAALLWQDELSESLWGMEPENIDPRLQVGRDEWELIPDRFEITAGVVCPKEWATPNRLAKSDLWEEQFNALKASGVEHMEATRLASERVREILLTRHRSK